MIHNSVTVRFTRPVRSFNFFLTPVYMYDYSYRNEDKAARHPYHKKRRSIQRQQKRVVPPFPKPTVHFNNILRSVEWKHFLEYERTKTSASTAALQARLVEAVDMSQSLLFFDDTLINKIEDTTEVQIDGTFQTRPRVPGVYQLFTFIAMKSNQVIYI